MRPAGGAPVSAPVRWEELDDPAIRSDRWTIRTIGARVKKVGDLFAPPMSWPRSCRPWRERGLEHQQNAAVAGQRAGTVARLPA